MSLVFRFMAVFALLALVVNAQVGVLFDQDISNPILNATDHGHSVDGVGDVDGDGRDDFVIGNPAYLFANGRVRVISGATGGVIWTVNGAIGDQLGFSVRGAGDINGDGIGDVVAGAPFSNGNGIVDSGEVQVLSGVNGAVIHQIEGSFLNAQLGYSVDGAGDSNGDGILDFVAGAPFENAGGGNEGRVRVYNGATGSVVYALTGLAGDRVGISVAGRGDFDGNGYDDIVFGATGVSTNNGRVRVAGVVQGPVGLPLVDILMSYTHPTAFSNLGTSVDFIGDVNGDGLDDVIAGAPGVNVVPLTDAGQCFIFRGPNGIIHRDHFGSTLLGDLGHAVSSAGDANGDGFSDYATGGDQIPVTIWSGLTGAPLGTANAVPTSTAYGFALGSAGDINGDGLDDLITGDPEDERVQVVSLVLDYPGSNRDLVLTSGRNLDPPSGYPDDKIAAPGDLMTLQMTSPGGTYDLTIPALVAQLLPANAPSQSPAGFPEVHVNPNAAVIFHNGLAAPFLGPTPLGPLGISLSFLVPPGLDGLAVIMQGACLAPNPGNPFFTATGAQRVRFGIAP